MKAEFYFTIIGIFLLATLSLPAISAQEISVKAPPLYMNANQCALADISIKNTGNQNLFFVDIPNQLNIPNCCTLTSSKKIEILEANSEDTIPIRICAPPSTIKGNYIHSLNVSSATDSSSVSLYIYVTKNFTDVLSDEIEQLDSSIQLIANKGLTINQFTSYIVAQQSLQESRTRLENGDFEDAIFSINKTRGFLELMESQTEGILATRFFVLLIVIVILVIGILYKVYKKRFAYQEIPGHDAEHIRKPTRLGKNSILKNIDMLEVKLSLLDKEKFTKKELEYYHKTHEALQKVREHIHGSNIEEAKKAFSFAEINLKVLEHRLASLRLLKASRELNRNSP